MMNIETLQAYLKLHFGYHRANGTLGVKAISMCNAWSLSFNVVNNLLLSGKILTFI